MNDQTPTRKRSHEYKPWTEEEKRILRENYPTRGGKTLELLPGRTLVAVRHRAWRLGVHRTMHHMGTPYWSEREEALMNRWYKYEGPGGMVRRLPNRNYESIKFKARQMGIRFGDVPDKEVYKWTTYSEICSETGLAHSVVARAVRRAGVGKEIIKDDGIGGRRVLVPADWARQYIDHINELKENRAYLGLWYETEQVKKLLCPNSVYSDRNHHHAVMEIEAKMCFPLRGGYYRKLWNPWQVEELRKKIGDNVAIISQEQLRILDLLEHHAYIVKRVRDNGLWDWEAVPLIPRGKTIANAKKSAVTRLKQFKLIEEVRHSDQTELKITERGQAELEAHRER